MPNTLIYLLDVTFYAIVPYLLWFAMFFFYFLLDLSKKQKNFLQLWDLLSDFRFVLKIRKYVFFCPNPKSKI